MSSSSYDVSPTGDQFVSLSELEDRYIHEVLHATGQNKTHAARILGIHPTSLIAAPEEDSTNSFSSTSAATAKCDASTAKRSGAQLSSICTEQLIPLESTLLFGRRFARHVHSKVSTMPWKHATSKAIVIRHVLHHPRAQ